MAKEESTPADTVENAQNASCRALDGGPVDAGIASDVATPSISHDEDSTDGLDQSNITNDLSALPTTTNDETKPIDKFHLHDRAAKISVTVVKESTEIPFGIGLTLSPNANDQMDICISAVEEQGLLSNAPIHEGDILKSINRQKMTDPKTALEMLQTIEPGIPITLHLEVPVGNPVLAQALIIKPIPSNLVGIELLAVQGQPKNAPSNNDEGEESPTKETTLLQINKIVRNGLLSQSVLNKGDLVMTINDQPCSHWLAADAAASIGNEPEVVSIVVMQPPGDLKGAKKWLRHARRAGIAIGGGTMVGIGLIFIPTLPPPFGEILIAGGVSVLGTEFEGPKRVVRSARDSLERVVGREALETHATETVEGGECGAVPELDNESGVITDTNNNTDCSIPEPEVKKKTMGDRFKKFGRNVVLPFLDQVVGDRKEGEEKDDAGTESEIVVTTESSESTGADDGTIKNGNSELAQAENIS